MWFMDTDGVWCFNVNKSAIITSGINFVTGNDADCNAITVDSVEASGDGVTVTDVTLSDNNMTYKSSGVGDVQFKVILSTGDERYIYRRFKESTRSANFS